MKTIELTQGQIALVDDEDFDYLNQFKWYAFKRKNTFYARRRKGKYKVFMHREILGLTDPKILSDHKDGNGLNNQRNNIRKATHAQNMANCTPRKTATSKYRGVYWSKKAKKWGVVIQKNKILKYLGLFNSEIQAAVAYNVAAKKLHGEFAKLNKL